MSVPPPTGIREDVAPAGVVRWQLCDPARRNPVSPAILAWIAARCQALAGEIVVLSSSGDETFCSGFDLDALAASDDDVAEPDAPLAQAIAAMAAADATFVAAIGGHVIGAGVELAWACDLQIACRGITVQIPAARLGVVYRRAGVAALQRMLGHGLLTRLLLVGERVAIEDVAAASALTELVDREALGPCVEAVVARLTAGDPLARAGNRDSLRAVLRDPGAVADETDPTHARRRRDAFARARARLRRP